ncbi:hypothetical protein KP509_19G042700 [Ceratopteris richardii]|uniref:Uncharacterized protein n=1 Tax=Ceratopteris richardii TaxID=49495 RepID=A0A8T2SNG0_CERRI|nr:hypothetical protein KP509_19G042700 [Ceratopteris richardii]
MDVQFALVKDKSKVAYMEVHKQFVEVIACTLGLPLSTVITLFEAAGSGSGDGPEYVKNLSNSLINLIDPPFLHVKEVSVPRLKSVQISPYVYRCLHGCNGCVSSVYGSQCRTCLRFSMRTITPYDGPSPYDINLRLSNRIQQANSSTSHEKHFPSFIITDNLSIFPVASDICLQVLRESGIDDPSELQHVDYKISFADVIEIVKASLSSLSVLTDIFVDKLKANKVDAMPRV